MPCFAAGTPILLADGRNVAIEDITPGMRVAAFDERHAAGTGPLQHGLVARLIHGITTEWIVLDDGTRVTPHHRYLRPDGSFMAIADIVAADGLVCTIHHELIGYSEDPKRVSRTGRSLSVATRRHRVPLATMTPSKNATDYGARNCFTISARLSPHTSVEWALQHE